MEYHKEDRWLLGLKEEADRTGWYAVWFLILLIIGNLALGGCDAESAEVTAKIEADAHLQKQTTMAYFYAEAWEPFKASQAGVTITVCQNNDTSMARKWKCWGGK